MSQTTSSPSSLRVELLRLMVETVRSPHRKRVGPLANDTSPRKPGDRYVGLGVPELTDAIRQRLDRGIATHDVVHVLFALQKAQLVYFNTSKDAKNDNGVPVRIMVTPKALQEDAMAEAALLTDDVPPTEEAAPPTDEMSPPAPEPEATPSLPATGEARRAATVTEAYLELRYPTIMRTVRFQSQVSEAIRLLDLAGQSEVSGLAREQLNNRSPLELEVADFFKEVLENQGGTADEESQEGVPIGKQ